MDIKASIEDTRKGFEESFATGTFYNRQTQDTEHLVKILSFIGVKEGMKIKIPKLQLKKKLTKK